MGITPGGLAYAFASNRLTGSKFVGPCFAPDGRTSFVNIRQPGLSLAVWGPFIQPSATGQRRMERAVPPEGIGPDISGELAEAAQRHGMRPLEVAAEDRLGAPLT